MRERSVYAHDLPPGTFIFHLPCVAEGQSDFRWLLIDDTTAIDLTDGERKHSLTGLYGYYLTPEDYSP